MATQPRIPDDLVAGFAMMAEDGDTPAARIAIPTELSRLAAIPIMSEGSFQIDPVVHECIRLFNANFNGCTYCQNARQAVAVQAGLNEDMVAKLMNFERSDLPEHVKAALKIPNAIHSGPQTLTQEVWDHARKYYSEQEVVDIVLLSMHGCGSKVAVTLGSSRGRKPRRACSSPPKKFTAVHLSSSVRSKNSSARGSPFAKRRSSTIPSTSRCTSPSRSSVEHAREGPQG